MAQRFAWALVLLASCAAAGCEPAAPEIVAIEYLRATRTSESDRAVALLDIGRIVERVQREVVMVNTEGDPEEFLRDSVATILWGLFQETPQEENLTYEATRADLDGDRAEVVVSMVSPDGTAVRRTVFLRRTSQGWRVSGASLDDLVTYVIQRLEERF